MTKTSFAIPEDLLDRARHAAIDAKTTLQQVAIDGIRLRVEQIEAEFAAAKG